MIDRRFARQLRLPEVGAAGQARLAEARCPRDYDMRIDEVIIRYTLRAGMRVTLEAPAGDAMASAPPWLRELRDGPRQVAAGAHVVLGVARRALGLDA